MTARKTPTKLKPKKSAQKSATRGIEQGSRALYERPRYYDHAYRAHRKDIGFYAQLAVQARGPVLELGAGTGRITLELARAGATVVGVDLSRAMLKRAEQRRERLPRAARERITFMQGDMRSLRLRRRFALVIAPFNLFMHLYTREDLERGLATVRAHLAPTGHFAFDVLMPDLGALRRDPAHVYRCKPVLDPSDGKRYAYGETFDYDAVSQVQHVRMMFQRLDKPDEDRTTPLDLRCYFPEELLTLLHYNGFAVAHRFGDFLEGPFTPRSDSQVIVARVARVARVATSKRK